MKAIVALHGDLPGQEFVKKLTAGIKIIVAADGAARKLQTLGVKPSTVVGDMDSLDNATLEKMKRSGIKVVSLPTEKDFTDGFFALEEAVRQGATEILLLGVFGGPRLDHSAANLLMLCARNFDGVTITAIDERNSLTVVRKQLALAGKRGELVSLVPIGSKVSGINTSGLKYVLKDGTLETGSTRGVSNVMTSSKATVSVKLGLLLVVHHKARK